MPEIVAFVDKDWYGHAALPVFFGQTLTSGGIYLI